MINKYFDKALKNTSKDSKVFVKKNLAIIDRIHEILETKNKTISDLAKDLNISDYEMHERLAPLYNFDLNFIAGLEAILGEEIIQVFPKKKVPVYQFKTPKETHIEADKVIAVSVIGSSILPKVSGSPAIEASHISSEKS